MDVFMMEANWQLLDLHWISNDMLLIESSSLIKVAGVIKLVSSFVEMSIVYLKAMVSLC